jgi:hypothetical protein
MKLKISFVGSDKIFKNYSQAAQDIFVLVCLDGKRNGTFLDLGCNHPTIINNTYLLEKEFDWIGVSIDIATSMTNLYGDRKTTVLNEDCTKLDFKKIKDYFSSNHIDYLSLDLEPASVTLDCLRTIPFNDIEFSIITYEHDSYRFGNLYRNSSREIIEKFGYKRICSDVKNEKNSFEDWYYNPKFVPSDRIKSLESDSLEWRKILEFAL